MNSLSYEQRKAALIEEINCAFDGVSREGGVSLSESYIVDDYRIEDRNHELRREARAKDTETRWQGVPEEDIANGYSCLSFMDEIGFRYYIPAYIVWFLRNIDNMDPESPAWDSNTFDFLIYALGGGKYSGLDEFYLSRYRRFTKEQSRAVAHFLVFAARQEEASGMLVERDIPREEMDAICTELEQMSVPHGLPDCDERRALEGYWGQFL